ncbi:MAG: hypothetical protein C0504_11730 [Candidatus Solibacter sp.]|nr:hypothetical protein [Candidatus Solibacter sp.]
MDTAAEQPEFSAEAGKQEGVEPAGETGNGAGWTAGEQRFPQPEPGEFGERDRFAAGFEMDEDIEAEDGVAAARGQRDETGVEVRARSPACSHEAAA